LEREAENCLGLGIVDTLISRPETYPKFYLWLLRDQTRVVGAAWMTPPHPLGLTAMSNAALTALIDVVDQIGDRPKAVVGSKSVADQFKDQWLARHRLKLSSSMAQRIYQARSVIQPSPLVAGKLRCASEQDRSLLEEWCYRFSVDCGLNLDRAGARHRADQAIRNQSHYLWTVADEPVSMAAITGQTPSGIRLSWVYTPDRWRGRGFASAIVAAVAQKMLNEGKLFCFLYTDLANPTSNSIYQKIGFRPVCDSAHHAFETV
jgi:predicted GNAT family acetyltransferase